MNVSIVSRRRQGSAVKLSKSDLYEYKFLICFLSSQKVTSHRNSLATESVAKFPTHFTKSQNSLVVQTQLLRTIRACIFFVQKSKKWWKFWVPEMASTGSSSPKLRDPLLDAWKISALYKRVSPVHMAFGKSWPKSGGADRQTQVF